MKWEIEVLSPSHYNNTTQWFLGDEITKWTPEENKLFENALALYDKETPDRWHRVAEMIPGKTVLDVMNQYKELESDVCDIENGLVPIPGYTGTSSCSNTNTTTTTSPPFTLDWVHSNSSGFEGLCYSASASAAVGRRSSSSSSSRNPDQERKKGVPWTEEEHKLFLLGLKKYGKGDWRNISRNFVITRTPTQVASHAQKYFIRQLSGGKDKRRASIHDITTVNLTENNRTTTPSEESKRSNSPQNSMMFSNQQQQQQQHQQQQQQQPSSTASSATSITHFQWNNNNNPSHEEMFTSPYGANSYGFKMQGQNLHNQTQNMAFQMQSSSQHYSHA